MLEHNESGQECYQLTTGHSPTDNRILHLMARTLASAGCKSRVAGVACDDSVFCGIDITACPRVAKGVSPHRVMIQHRLFQFALQSSAKVFQIHDPDMLPWALLLRLLGRKVIYDVHDDYQASFRDRLRNKRILRFWLPSLWWWFERCAARCMNGVIVADRHLAKKFKACPPVILGNYPRRDFTKKSDVSNEETFNLIYVGGLTRERGLEMVFHAMQLLPEKHLRLHLIGNCGDENLLKMLRTDKRIILHGRVDWTELHEYYERAHVGLALYQPLDCFMYCPGENAVKILEYMAAGIPVLCSDFPGLRIFVEDSGYGLVVKPDDPMAIATKIKELFSNPELRTRLGASGRERFESEYNWEKHENRLIELYDRVLKA